MVIIRPLRDVHIYIISIFEHISPLEHHGDAPNTEDANRKKSMLLLLAIEANRNQHLKRLLSFCCLAAAAAYIFDEMHVL